jgi:membrane protease subunit HflC
MSRSLGVLLVAAAALLLLVVLGQPLYIVSEGTQAVITRFGEPIGRPIADAGLHAKVPFVDVVHRFEKRILEWDGDENEVPTKDKRFIWIDTTARWRIVDPLRFLQSVGDERGAHARLDDIIDAETRDVITEQPLVEVVRSSNRLLDEGVLEAMAAGDADLTQQEAVRFGRTQLTREILLRVEKQMPRYGIELVDIRIKRINYIDEVREKIYERMIAERRRAAEQFRSEGQGKKAEIEGRAERDLKRISSEAYEKAQEIKGRADAEATRITAEAFGQDPELYEFLKTLDTYEATVDSRSTLVLTTDSDYFRYLKDAGPNAP